MIKQLQKHLGQLHLNTQIFPEFNNPIPLDIDNRQKADLYDDIQWDTVSSESEGRTFPWEQFRFIQYV